MSVNVNMLLVLKPNVKGIRGEEQPVMDGLKATLLWWISPKSVPRYKITACDIYSCHHVDNTLHDISTWL